MKAEYTKPRLVRLARTSKLDAAFAPAVELRMFKLPWLRAESSTHSSFGYVLVRAMRDAELARPDEPLHGGYKPRNARWLLVSIFVAFVLGLLAALAGGCGRVGYEGGDDEPGAIVDTWEREGGNGSCDESFTFDADGSFAWLMDCRNGTVQRVVGSYELRGDLLRFVPAEACTPPYNRQWAAVWHVDDYVLELNGGSYYRGELAVDVEPAELCP